MGVGRSMSESEEVIDFRVVELIDVNVPLPSQYAVVQLSELESPFRIVSVPIGLAEGAAVALARENDHGVRPTTHELFSDVLERLNVDVIALRITALVEGTFQAELDLMSPKGREILACRPSDGFILCLRQSVPAPILVNAAILESENPNLES